MNLSSRFRLSLILTPLLLFGCGANESAVVGHWKGKVALSKEQQSEPFSNLAEGLASSVSLDVKADHTFHMTAMIFPIDGTWTMSGHRVTFTPTSVLGFKNTDGKGMTNSTSSGPKTEAKPFEVDLSSDGRALEPVNNGTDQDRRGDFTFTKEE